jgi:hypothetical protein
MFSIIWFLPSNRPEKGRLEEIPTGVREIPFKSMSAVRIKCLSQSDEVFIKVCQSGAELI